MDVHTHSYPGASGDVDAGAHQVHTTTAPTPQRLKGSPRCQLPSCHKVCLPPIGGGNDGSHGGDNTSDDGCEDDADRTDRVKGDLVFWVGSKAGQGAKLEHQSARTRRARGVALKQLACQP